MATALSEPKILPRSGPVKRLVVFLHGYGADGDDLIEIGRQWQEMLPETAFIAPHAPNPCGMSPTGREWFPLTFRDPHERWRGVTQARPGLDALLDSKCAEYGVDESQLALVGFSQGTMMALHVGLRRKRRIAAVLGYSGLLVLENGQTPEALKEQAVTRPPILLVHGDRDEVIPVEALFMSANHLASAEIACEWHLSLGIGHGIDPEGLRQGEMFLARRFGLDRRPPNGLSANSL